MVFPWIRLPVVESRKEIERKEGRCGWGRVQERTRPAGKQLSSRTISWQFSGPREIQFPSTAPSARPSDSYLQSQLPRRLRQKDCKIRNFLGYRVISRPV